MWSVGRIMPKTRYLLVYRADIVWSVGRVCVKSTVILKVQGLCTCLLAMWCNLWSVGRICVKKQLCRRFFKPYCMKCRKSLCQKYSNIKVCVHVVSHVMHYMKYLCQNSFVGGFLSHIVWSVDRACVKHKSVGSFAYMFVCIMWNIGRICALIIEYPFGAYYMKSVSKSML